MANGKWPTRTTQHAACNTPRNTNPASRIPHPETMSQMLKSSGAMGIATLCSRVLGMVREMCYARFMGDTLVAGVFLFAFMIPNLFRRLLGEGALSAAFIPLFKEKEKTAGEKDMWESANAVISWLVIVACAVVGVVLLVISLTLDFMDLTSERRLMLELLRIMFPYMLLVCVAAVFIGMLNARGHFFIPAMGATMLNVVMIVAVLFVAPGWGETLETQIFALAFAVLVAGVAQAAFQLPTLRKEGFRFRWVSPWKHETVRVMVKRMIPGTIGVAAIQINLLLTNSIALAVDGSIVASFNYAVRLMELPQGVFGVSLATFLLPALAGLAAEKKMTEFSRSLGHAIDYLFFLNLFVGALLLVLAEPIVRLLFERGEFGPEATGRAALALMCLAPGLVAFSAVNIFARAFFALGDTRTPMRISVGCLILNLMLVLALIRPFQQAGMALANSITSTLNAFLLFAALKNKCPEVRVCGDQRGRILVGICTLIGAAVAWKVWALCEAWLGNASLIERIATVFVPLFSGGAVYLVATLRLKVTAAKELVGLATGRFRKGRPKGD